MAHFFFCYYNFIIQMKAMLFAAGMGTRLKPLTDTMPKALVPVNGKPLLEHTIERLCQAGVTEVVVNVHHFANQIIDYVKSHEFDCKVLISDESDELLDTGGGLKKAAVLLTANGKKSCGASGLDEQNLSATLSDKQLTSTLKSEDVYNRRSVIENLSMDNSTVQDSSTLGLSTEDFSKGDSLTDVSAVSSKSNTDGADVILIHNVDIFSNADLKDFYERNKRNAVTLLVSPRTTSRYLLFNDNNELVGWTNVKTGEVRSPYPHLDVSACHKYAFSGIHLFSPSAFTLMDSFPEKFPIMDFYLSVCDKIKIIGDVQQNLRLLDVGKQDTLQVAESFLEELGRR